MASPPSRLAVLYAAKSTEDVRGSIGTQLTDCRAMAEREGFEVVGEYHDEGFSAYSGNRGPDLEAAREHASRVGGVLVAQHSDRVARGAGDRPDAADHLVEVVVALRRAGAQLRTCQDDFFADPRIGLVMASLMGQRNTEDSLRKSEATKAGKRRAWERGDFPGGPPADGFEVIRGVQREVRLDPDRIDVIRLIGELADQGWGDPSIARELNRRGIRTKGGGAWTRRRVQDLLSNPLYYGGIPWRRGKPDQEINWQTSYPAPWTREDFERRRREIKGRDLAKGSDRRPKGRPHVNHALAGLARCIKCGKRMRPITSTYRRKDGSRKRTYVCRHVHGCTGLCDMPPFDAEAIDSHVVNELQLYLGDFEAWRDQLVSGYASERQRLEREVESARGDLTAQEQICNRTDRAIGLAESDDDAKAAMRAAATAHQELERRQRRVEAARQALSEVPDEAPADAMLDFYNELSGAVRGRLDGANTIARVNDALKDIFNTFYLDPAPGLACTIDEGVAVIPVLRRDRTSFFDLDSAARQKALMPHAVTHPEPIVPPLRKILAPSAKLANAHKLANNAQVLPPMVVPA